jgi:hypothetical protein
MPGLSLEEQNCVMRITMVSKMEEKKRISVSNIESIVKKPNICMLHKLIYPTKDGEEFKLEEVKRYQHEE